MFDGFLHSGKVHGRFLGGLSSQRGSNKVIIVTRIVKPPQADTPQYTDMVQYLGKFRLHNVRGCRSTGGAPVSSPSGTCNSTPMLSIATSDLRYGLQLFHFQGSVRLGVRLQVGVALRCTPGQVTVLSTQQIGWFEGAWD